MEAIPAAISAMELAELLELAANIALTVNTVQSLYKAMSIVPQDGSESSELRHSNILNNGNDPNELEKGNFRMLYLLGTEEEEISRDAFLGMMTEETLECVKRFSRSSTGWFPSGVFTPFTWILVGQAVRHEFILLQTQRYCICIDVNKDATSGEFITTIKAIKAETNTGKANAITYFRKLSGYWDCEMNTLEGEQLAKIKVHQVLGVTFLWVKILKKTGNKSSIWNKNSKTLARSIYYFCFNKIDYDEVLKSIWGMYTDKPLKVLYNPLAIIPTEGVFQATKVISKTKDLRSIMIDSLKFFREEMNA